MYIIDRNKDYYDYLSHVYGVDKKVVFDRRGSVNLTDEELVNLLKFNLNEKRPLYWNHRGEFFILEIGYIQYLVYLKDFKTKHFKYISSKMECKHIFRNNVHYYDKPISIRRVNVEYNWGWDWRNKKPKEEYWVITNNYKETITKVYDDPINLPILKDTQLTQWLDPEEVWKELQNYISSLKNDKDVDLKMSDVEKAEIHGFDKKTSFRNPIK
jgi:hypothetical protein